MFQNPSRKKRIAGKVNKLIRKQQNTRADDVNQKRKLLEEVKSNLLSPFWQRMKHVGELQMTAETNCRTSHASHLPMHFTALKQTKSVLEGTFAFTNHISSQYQPRTNIHVDTLS